METHFAAVLPAKGVSLQLESRPTPKPGPGELLVEVKSVALNPADGIMRDQGIHIPTYPTIIGFDISGLVLQVGSDVPAGKTDQLSGPCFRPGITRVAAYSASVWRACDPNYGAFQQLCLLPWQHAVPLPNEDMSWNEAATLPVSVQVPLSAWDALGIPRLGAKVQGERRQKNEALLIWGASSSVGTMGVQSGRLLRDDHGSSFAAVYATAGAANQKYISSLGADRVFDYKDPQVVDAIISAAKQDRLAIRHCFLAMGQIALCQAVLQAFAGPVEGGEKQKGKIGSAPPVPLGIEHMDGVEVIFVLPSMDDEEARLAQFRYWMGTWLKEQLINKTIRPSPEPRVVGKGLEAINEGLNMILRGVNCTKLVVEIAV